VNRSGWLLYGGLLGIFVWLFPNVSTAPLPRGEEVTVRLGAYSWFEYRSRTERWEEGGKDVRRTETNTHVSLVNPSVFAGAIGLGLLVAYYWRARPLRHAHAPHETASSAERGTPG